MPNKSNRIGIVSTRLVGIDGVSLEVVKYHNLEIVLDALVSVSLGSW